jgi:hypothetical protein
MGETLRFASKHIILLRIFEKTGADSGGESLLIAGPYAVPRDRTVPSAPRAQLGLNGAGSPMAHNEVVKGRASPIRRFLSIRVLLQAVTGVMTLALVAVLAVYALDALKSQERARRVPAIIDISNDLFVAVQNFRLERGNVYTSLATPGIVAPMTQSAIMAERQRSRSALDSALVQLRTLKVEGTGPAIADISEQRAAFEKLRLDVDAALLQSQEQRHLGLRAKWVEGYNGIADAIDRLSARMESELTQGDPFVANMVRIKQIAWTVREDTGRDRFRIGEAIANGKRL